jgi:hypothetical protein
MKQVTGKVSLLVEDNTKEMMIEDYRSTCLSLMCPTNEYASWKYNNDSANQIAICMKS